MSKILMIVCSFFALAATAPTQLKAESSVEQRYHPSENFTVSWTGNDDYLFLNIAVKEGLKLPEEYRFSASQKGQGCGISCSPKVSGKVFSSSGDEILEAKLCVEITNVDKKTLSYKLTYGVKCKERKPDGMISQVYTSTTINGTIANPSLDLSFDPEFSIFQNADNEGVMAFKNSYPYSKMK